MEAIVAVEELTLVEAARTLQQFEDVNDLSSRDFYRRFRSVEFVGSNAAIRWATYYELFLELVGDDVEAKHRDELLISA